MKHDFSFPRYRPAFVAAALFFIVVSGLSGMPNIVWENRISGQRALWRMSDSISGFSPASVIDLGLVDASWALAGLGDFNNDGQADILWQNLTTGQRALWLMKSIEEGFSATAVIDLGRVDSSWQIAGIADFNRDGHADILWQNRNSGQRALWLMTGVSGTTCSSIVDLGVVDASWSISGIGDFNNDGQVDVLWQNLQTGQRALWLMPGSGLTFVPTSVVNLGFVDANWVMAGVGDFNADWQPDILWQNKATGQRALWLMSGLSRGFSPLNIVDLGFVDTSWSIASTDEVNIASGSGQAIPASDAESARFLIQSSFGPTAASIKRVREIGFGRWFEEQISLQPTYHLPYYRARATELIARTGQNGYAVPRQEAWWQHAVTSSDQLRQRMAFALSEILVVSQVGSLDGDHEGVTAYYDLLVRHAFGNYRQLLEEVTLSPIMGTYLSMIRNRKPDNVSGTQPDENYARECMQLFTIGLSELNIDGTLRLGSDGQSIPTYSQSDIVGLAHVFTGWGPNYDLNNAPKWSNGTTATANDWFQWGWDALRPMTYNAKYGDAQPRQIVGGTVVSGGLSGQQRLGLALDTLFNHPNVGPFLAKQLIQRFVTSNPSPAYVRRVALAFSNNGQGIRGDLAATLRAVLLDPEARRPLASSNVTFGKLTEPLLHVTRLLRAFPPIPPPHASLGDNRLFLHFLWDIQEQAPLMSPSVFNFFRPGYSQPGKIAVAGLVSPEFQLLSDTTAVKGANRDYSMINWGLWIGEPSGGADHSEMDLDLREPLAILTAAGRTHPQAQADLVEYLNQRMLAGNMSSFLRQKILDTYNSLPKWFDYSAASELERIQLGLYLVTFSPEFAVQR